MYGFQVAGGQKRPENTHADAELHDPLQRDFCAVPPHIRGPDLYPVLRPILRYCQIAVIHLRRYLRLSGQRNAISHEGVCGSPHPWESWRFFFHNNIFFLLKRKTCFSFFIPRFGEGDGKDPTS